MRGNQRDGEFGRTENRRYGGNSGENAGSGKHGSKRRNAPRARGNKRGNQGTGGDGGGVTSPLARGAVTRAAYAVSALAFLLVGAAVFAVVRGLIVA